MFKTIVHALVVGVLLCGSASLQADPSAKKLTEINASLDEAVSGKKARKLAPKLAELIGVEQAKLEQLLVKDKVPFSSVVSAQMVAQKTQEPLDAILKRHQPNGDWGKTLEAAGWTLAGALERLEHIETETFVLVLDLRT